MENNEFTKIDIKNRACYYYDDIIMLEDFDLDNILIEKNSYNISYNTLIYPKLLCTVFFKENKIIRIFDETRYLTSLSFEKCEALYNISRCLISQKVASYIFFLLIF